MMVIWGNVNAAGGNGWRLTGGGEGMSGGGGCGAEMTMAMVMTAMLVAVVATVV